MEDPADPRWFLCGSLVRFVGFAGRHCRLCEFRLEPWQCLVARPGSGQLSRLFDLSMSSSFGVLGGGEEG
jgi:hypothetical protein